jgi:hypothetical protein
MMDYRLICGDCRDVLPTLSDASADAIICDPPYPHINRPYGMMTEAEWHAMMKVVVPECRRVLKPTGSAVFILQPNSRKVGSMRLWLWEFIVWAGREWNLVQNAYWWNICAMVTGGAGPKGMLRDSLKYCVWLGDPDCYRDQGSVLWEESVKSRVNAMSARCNRARPSGWRGTAKPKFDSPRRYEAAGRRGGVTPFNVLPMGNGDGNSEGGAFGHVAATPIAVADWWVRYISPPDGVVLDPFCGVGSVGLAALKLGRSFIGIDKMPEYVEIARRRLDALVAESPLFTGLSAPLASSEATR